MSIAAVTSRIDQILAMQQQLADPGSAAASSATSTSSGGASLGAPGQPWHDRLRADAGPGDDEHGQLAGRRVVRLRWRSRRLGPQAGYDCSGFVSAVLHAGGYLSQPVDTALPQQAGMEPGPGQYVTVYDRAQPAQTGHVIIEIDGQFYESGGSRGAWGGGGGVEKIGTPSADYLATFPNVLHPAGL
jgi:hypothetical protein